ncbi:autotransporter domain-containing protein [Thermodesulfobium sp. 4217-1]|uniref:autotransporter outer membrane beta-barrel domain-containing protein n=1 Tax=Thermodesulfobium sp. 4217-1 TaxID=3120013 RepID=UPI0032215A4E
MFVGSDVFVSGETSTGTYNLSGGTIVVTRLLEASGAELIGDSAGIGTFNQTGGQNLDNNGVFIGSDAAWRYSNKLVKGSIGIYNLSGGILNTGGTAVADVTAGDGGEVVGDAGGTGIFNQTGGTNIATDGGLAVGSDIYGAGVGGVGTFNLSGGSLIASGLVGSIGGEVIGTCQGIGTFNQTGGTNTVLAGLFVGSQVTYPLAPTKNITPGTGTYNLSAGTLTASGNGTPGTSGYIPGEDIGDAGSTGTFTQTGGTNTVTNGLLVGTDLFDSIGAGTGTGKYNLSGGVLQADFEWVGGSNAGTFTQTGGINIVTGNNAQYGIEMNSGTYHLNGGILSTSSIDGNLDNEGGVFMPSKAGSIFTGNYIQGKNSALQIGIASSSNYNWLEMSNTGTVQFNGGTIEPVLQGGFVPIPGQTFDIIKDAQNITGTPTVANFTATLVGIAGSIPDPGITISAARNYTNSVLTLTQNQRQVGNMLNDISATTTGDIGTVLHTIDSIPTSQANSVANAYQQISPDMAASLANLGFAASNFFQQDIIDRITSDRYARLSGENTGFYGPNETKKLNGWSFYADPQVSWGSQDSTANETGYNFSIVGLTVGADYRLRKDLLVGVASGYAHTYAGFNNNMGNVQNETVPIILYASYFPGKFYAFGSAGYTVNSFNTNRQISFINRTASGSTTGNMLNSYGEAGYNLRVGNVVITPMASLSYSSIWINGFDETGANSLDLQVGSQHAESLQFSPGVRLDSTVKYGKALVKYQLYANYAHEFANDSRNINASLAQVGIPFNFQSQQLGRDFGIIGANINVYSGKNFSVHLDSNTEIGRNNYSASMVDAKLSFKF